MLKIWMSNSNIWEGTERNSFKKWKSRKQSLSNHLSGLDLGILSDHHCSEELTKGTMSSSRHTHVNTHTHCEWSQPGFEPNRLFTPRWGPNNPKESNESCWNGHRQENGNQKKQLAPANNPWMTCCPSNSVWLSCFLAPCWPLCLSRLSFCRSETVLHQFCCPAPEHPEADTSGSSR